MRQGGSYEKDPATGEPVRKEWTKDVREVEAEANAAAAAAAEPVADEAKIATPPVPIADDEETA